MIIPAVGAVGFLATHPCAHQCARRRATFLSARMGEVWDNTQKFFGDMWDEIRNMQVPTLESNWGTGMFVVNILLPGVGTLVAGIKSERNTTMVIGVLQFLLAFLIVGWIWSIYWGWLIYKKAQEGYIPSSV